MEHFEKQLYCDLGKECRHTAGWGKLNLGGAGKLSPCSCMVIKKYYNKQNS